MTLIYLAVAWLLGIIAADMAQPAVATLALLCAAGAGAAVLGWRVRAVRLAALMLCCAALGGWRMEAARVLPTSHSIWLLNDHAKVALQGVIVEDPKWTETDQRVLIAAERVTLDGTAQPASGLVLAKLPPYPARAYGDRITVLGALQTPRQAEQPGQFDYRDYLARKQIFSIMTPTAARFESANNGNWAWATLLHLRDRARRVLLHELPEPEASLAVGILLGLQASIPDDVYSTFSVTGTSHILVISGWNITILSAGLAVAAGRLRLPHGLTFWVTLGTIWLYTLFVGASPTVIRAAVMGTVVVVGQRLDRQAHAWTTLFAACWAMTLWDPQTLWDLGFQLSAGATASLFAYGKGVEAWLLRTPLRVAALDWAREALTATLAAQVLALPLILYHFGNLSLIAPFANVMLLPVVPYAMLFGTLALVGGLVFLPLGQALAWLAYLPLTWLTSGARLLANLPWAAVQTPLFPLWLLLAYYALVIGWWLARQRTSEPLLKLAPAM